MKHSWPVQSIIFLIISYMLLQWQPVQASYKKDARLEAIIKVLANQLKSSNLAVRKVAILDLTKLNSKLVIPYLKKGLKDKHQFIRILSARALGEYKEKSVVPTLIGCLRREKEIFVQKIMIESLAKLKDQRSFWILTKFSRSPNILIKKVATQALKELEKPNSSNSFYSNFFKWST